MTERQRCGEGARGTTMCMVSRRLRSSHLWRFDWIEEKNNLLADIKEVFSEAKGLGYDPKIMRKVLIIRKMDIDERLEQEALLETYRAALGIY